MLTTRPWARFRCGASDLRTSGSSAAERRVDGVELDRLVQVGGRALAAARIGRGVWAVVSPRLAATPWVGWSSTHPAGEVLGRAAGARDIALGAGALLAASQGPREERTGGVLAVSEGPRAEGGWVGLAAFCDVGDAVTTAATWRRLPSPGRLLVGAAT